jgi:cytochrome P450
MLNPAFSVHAIRSMVPLMATPAYKLRDQWLKKMAESNSEYTEIEVSLGLSLATLDVIGLTAFGQDFKSVENYGTERLHKISKAYLNIFNDDFSWSQILQIAFPFINYLPTRRLFNTVRSLRWLHEEAEALVEAGIERAKKEKASGTSDSPKDLLALMVNLIDEGTGQGFTKEGLREQCLTFLAAG